MLKRKIINIMPFCPPYDLYWNDPRPRVNWDVPNGQWVGIWEYDWLNQIGTEVLMLTDDFVFEIWQPDYRADRVYSHTFPDGLVHRLFPAIGRKQMYGVKRIVFPQSESMMTYLVKEIQTSNILVRVMAMDKGIARDILRIPINFPCIGQFWGEFSSPIRHLHRFQKNIPAKLHDVREHFILKKLLSRVGYFTCCDEYSRKNIMMYTKNEIISLSIGINFDFWTPRKQKMRVRAKLGLNNKQKIFLSSARLVDAKQVDKVISTLNKLDKDHDFVYIVTGHGDEAYERYLSKLGAGLLKKGKLLFTGYIREKELFDYYTAADLFIMSSLSEAGPTATIIALAMGVPVFSTATGQMAEVLVRHGAGDVVPKKGYKVWERELREILCGKKVDVLDRDIVKPIHHWPCVAEQYIDLYRRVFREYCEY
ncbi:MAG: glycosyltransferase [candidate division WOR-3 bacterium]|nr:MAG: glycosyltransferase [candidate division WOR-3 bacterium]